MPVAWMINVSDDFTDPAKTPLSDRAFRIMLVLEGFARTRTHCSPAAETLAKLTGKHERIVREILAELEDAGWIRRVYGSRKERLGIILLRRASVDMPAADTPGRVAEAEAELRGGRAGR
jgi:DNA-binding IclR family transcriptional regulator